MPTAREYLGPDGQAHLLRLIAEWDLHNPVPQPFLVHLLRELSPLDDPYPSYDQLREAVRIQEDNDAEELWACYAADDMPTADLLARLAEKAAEAVDEILWDLIHGDLRRCMTCTGTVRALSVEPAYHGLYCRKHRDRPTQVHGGSCHCAVCTFDPIANTKFEVNDRYGAGR